MVVKINTSKKSSFNITVVWQIYTYIYIQLCQGFDPTEISTTSKNTYLLCHMQYYTIKSELPPYSVDHYILISWINLNLLYMFNCSFNQWPYHNCTGISRHDKKTPVFIFLFNQNLGLYTQVKYSNQKLP